MIFRTPPPKEPPKVSVSLQVIKLDDHTILLKVGGTSYHLDAGEWSRGLAKGTEFLGEKVR